MISCAYLKNNFRISLFLFRHWSWLANTLGLTENRIDGGLSLKCFLALDNQSLENVVTRILTQVTAERDIERMLGKVAESWEEHKFTFERWTAATAAAAAAPTPTDNNGGIEAPHSAVARARVGGASTNNDPSNSVLIIIAGLSDTLAMVDDDYLILSKALDSPSSQFFLEDLMTEKDSLCNISDVLSLWKDVQEDCLVLARVLLQPSRSTFQPTAKSAAELQLKTNFDIEFRRYSKLMSEVIKKPVIKQCCLNQSQDLRGALLNFKSLFHQQRLEFAKLIQDKQRILPRLNFLSFHEILVILGGWHGNEVEFQRAAKNLLGRGVSKICVVGSSGHQVENGSRIDDVGGEDVVVIRGLETQDGDAIELARTVVLGGVGPGGDHFPDSQSECGKGNSADDGHSNDDDVNKEVSESHDDGIGKVPSSSTSPFGISTCGRIEGSLSLLICESQSSVARNLVNVLRVSPALLSYRLKDYLANIEQISATEFECMWTREFSAALQSVADCRIEYKRLHRVFDNLAKSLIVLIACGDDGIDSVEKSLAANTVKASNTVTITSRTKNLLTLAMEKKKLCRDFLRGMVTTVDDYNWQSLLRTSLDSESGNGICLMQGRAKLSYGNEFHSAFLG